MFFYFNVGYTGNHISKKNIYILGARRYILDLSLVLDTADDSTPKDAAMLSLHMETKISTPCRLIRL